MKYQPDKIEKKWQKIWRAKRVFEPDLSKTKRPFYNLMMFPYPSAQGLHVGNMYAFTGSDIFGRFKKMQGHDVFEPIGLDGFGIHSENYALKAGKHPMEMAKLTEKNFYRQLKETGNAYSWEHKLETYDPNYYKWTQWLFLQLYKAGLAYQKEAPANFCPSCKTVLADEQVIQGKCERCGSEVEIKFLKQWFFKITKYAERLLKNLEKLDWSERVKIAQKNWIGRSEGALVKFSIFNLQFSIEAFTTRVDTIFGATYLVLSPFHELIRKNKLQISQKAVEYVKKALKKSKKEASDEKNGVFSGLYAINPATNKKIPIWISDYVLAGYGTGAIMAVPAHDQRDFEFARKYNLPLKEVIQNSKFKIQNYKSKFKSDKAYEGEGVLINSAQFNGLKSQEGREKILNWLKEKGAAQKAVSYHLRDWLISRQRYWGPPIPVIYCDKCGIVPVPEKDLPVKLPYVKNFKPLGTGKSPLANYPKFYKTKCPVCKGSARRETDVSDTFLDSSWYFIGYLLNLKSKIRDSQFVNSFIQKWLPVDMYIGGAEHSVLHLMYARFISMVLKDLGFIHFEEPFKKFRAHGLLISQGAKMSKSKGNVVNPDEYIKKYGADTLRMYLMFLGPFEQGGDFRDEGIVGIWRFLNRVWQLIQKFKARNPKFETNSKFEINPPGSFWQRNSKLTQLMHQTIKKVTEDIENLKFNTAIAALMEYLNAIESAKVGTVPTLHIKTLVLLLAPFAPHITEELYQFFQSPKSKVKSQNSKLKVKSFKSIFEEKWPKYDPKMIEEETFQLVVQINGKTRDVIEAKVGISEEEARELALKSPQIKKWLESKQISKTFYIKDRLINFLTE